MMTNGDPKGWIFLPHPRYSYPILSTHTKKECIIFLVHQQGKLMITCTCEVNKSFQPNIRNIFLSIIFSICFGCSKDPSH